MWSWRGKPAASARAGLAESKRRALGIYFSERICYMFPISKCRGDRDLGLCTTSVLWFEGPQRNGKIRKKKRVLTAALLEALCARICSVGFVNISFVSEICFFVYLCVCKVSHKAFLLPLSTRLLCLVVSIPLVCWLYMCACVCVPLYVHVKMCR